MSDSYSKHAPSRSADFIAEWIGLESPSLVSEYINVVALAAPNSGAPDQPGPNGLNALRTITDRTIPACLRAEAIRDLVHAVGPTAVDDLERIITTHPSDHAIIIAGLGLVPIPRAAPLLERAAAHPEEPVRLAAFHALTLWGVNARDYLGLILEAARTDTSGAVSGAASSAAAHIAKAVDDPRITHITGTTLRENARHGAHPTQRQGAIAGLGLLGEPHSESIDLLIDSLADSSVSGAAVEALALIGSPVIPPLIDCIRRRNPLRRAAASRVLGLIGASAIPALTPLLDHPRADVRREATEALGDAIAERTRRIPLAALDSADTLARFFKVCANTRDLRAARFAPTCLPALERNLTASNEDLVSETLVTLGSFGSAAAPVVPSLIPLVNHPRTKLRTTVLRVLEPLLAGEIIPGDSPNGLALKAVLNEVFSKSTAHTEKMVLKRLLNYYSPRGAAAPTETRLDIPPKMP
jgi:HEAT repeat protein